jgi:mannose-1-phosphate guanylyltransferase
MEAVVQCGGKGMRLRPYTSILPKPLMPVGTRPVLEMLLKWLRRNNFEHVYVTTGYLGHLIRSYCGDGRQWGIRLEYTEEGEPLGTVGALTLIREKLDSTFLVVNGDVLTDLNLKSFIAHHARNEGLLTISTTLRPYNIDYGVIEDQAGVVTGFIEKPTISNLVSMGIYCMEPEVLELIPWGTPYGFDDLVLHMLELGAPVRHYRHAGTWLDVGRAEDFMKAQEIEWDEQAIPMTPRAA